MKAVSSTEHLVARIEQFSQPNLRIDDLRYPDGPGKTCFRTTMNVTPTFSHVYLSDEDSSRTGYWVLGTGY